MSQPANRKSNRKVNFMSLPKQLLRRTGKLLVLGAALGLAACQTIKATAYGTLKLDKPLLLVTESNDEVVLLSTPSAKETHDFIQKILPTNPDRYGYRRVYSPQLVRVDRTGTQTNLPYTRHKITYQDPIKLESRTLDLLAFNTQQGKRWIAEPMTGSPQLVANPRNPNQLFFQDRDSYHLLYRLDAKALTITPINAEGLKAVRQKMKALPDHGEELNPILYWMEDITFSPDGSQIAFTSNRERIGQGSGVDVWLHDIATGQDTRVLSTKDVSYSVHGWTADGRIILRSIPLQDRQPSDTIVAFHPSTKATQELAKGYPWVVSDDGKTLLYQTIDKQFLGVPETKPPQPLTTQLRALSLMTGKQQLLYRNTESERWIEGYPLDFSADGERIVTVVANTQRRTHSLLVYDLKQQQAKRFPLPEGWQPQNSLNSERIEWAHDHLLVPLVADQNDKKLMSETLLLSVEP